MPHLHYDILIGWQAPLISMAEPVAAAGKTTAVAMPTATDLLVDVFGDLPPPQLNLPVDGNMAAVPSELTPGAEEGYERCNPPPPPPLDSTPSLDSTPQVLA